MIERPDDLRDDVLAARLRAGLGSRPPRLASRLEHLATAGLHDRRPSATPLWLEVAPQLAGGALVLALLTRVLAKPLALLSSTAPPGAPSPPTPLSPVWSGALTALMVPIAVLMWVEALRGAPTVRRWLR